VRNLIIKLAITGAALWVAVALVPGLEFDGTFLQFVGVTAIVLVANAIVKPILNVLSIPLILLTLGLFLLITNALALQIAVWLSGSLDLGFASSGFFWATFLGALVISVVSDDPGQGIGLSLCPPTEGWGKVPATERSEVGGRGQQIPTESFSRGGSTAPYPPLRGGTLPPSLRSGGQSSGGQSEARRLRPNRLDPIEQVGPQGLQDVPRLASGQSRQRLGGAGQAGPSGFQ
jgi:putative membrane protein